MIRFAFLPCSYLVQVQVLALDATWPVLGCVNLGEGKTAEEEGPSPLNPFYHQERIAFRLSKPELALTPIGDHTAPQPPHPTLGGAALVSAPQRSISVVEVAAPSPATFATAAAAMDHLSDQREIGNSVFFKSRAQDQQTPGGSAGDDNGPKQTHLFDSQNPIQLLESPNFEAVVFFQPPPPAPPHSVLKLSCMQLNNNNKIMRQSCQHPLLIGVTIIKHPAQTIQVVCLLHLRTLSHSMVPVLCRKSPYLQFGDYP